MSVLPKKYDFKITDNLLVFQHQIVAIFQLEPLDFLLLPEEDQQHFESQIRKMLHSLHGQEIQLLVETRAAIPDDYYKHFDQVLSQAAIAGVDELQALSYVQQLTELIQGEQLPYKDYYLLLKEPTKAKQAQSFYQSAQRLNQQARQLVGYLSQAGLQIKQVTQENKQLQTTIRFLIRQI